MIYLYSIVASFLGCFIKGFQNKNVNGRHLKALYFTSWIWAFFDVIAVTLIVKGGWPIIFTSGFGASAGMVAAVLAHERIFRRRIEAAQV